MILRKYTIILVAIFLFHLFFRFYNLGQWATYGWDQVDNAWAAARILIAHKYPLIGMVAKQNSGMYIGPLYYYLVAVFYFFTRLNPIASPLLAGFSAIVSFWVIAYVSKKLFSPGVSLWSCFIYTFSDFIIRSERIQWPVNFIAPASLLILYFLYKVISGEPKYLIHVAIFAGLSFHFHFTAVFYPILIVLSLPFFPMKKISWKHVLVSLGIFILFFVPQILHYLTSKHANGIAKYTEYIRDYYHGLHLRRVMQLAHDAVIEFEAILELPYKFLRNAVFFWVPLFSVVSVRTANKNAWKLVYLIAIWIIVPWFVFSTYKGEISNYYFSVQLYLAVIVFAYLTHWLWERKNILPRILVILFWFYYAFANTRAFLATGDGNLRKDTAVAQQAVQEEKYINFTEGDPQSYLYFYLMYTQKQAMPYAL